MNETIIVAVITGIFSALLGSLLTAIAFMGKFGDRLTRMETKMDNLTKAFYEHVKQPPPQCSAHNDISLSLARQDERLKTVEGAG